MEIKERKKKKGNTVAGFPLIKSSFLCVGLQLVKNNNIEGLYELPRILFKFLNRFFCHTKYLI